MQHSIATTAGTAMMSRSCVDSSVHVVASRPRPSAASVGAMVTGGCVVVAVANGDDGDGGGDGSGGGGDGNGGGGDGNGGGGDGDGGGGDGDGGGGDGEGGGGDGEGGGGDGDGTSGGGSCGKR